MKEKIDVLKFLEQKETILLKLIIKNHFKIFFFVIISLMFFFMLKVPYVNLIFNKEFYLFCITLTFLIIFRVSLRIIIILSMFIFLFSILPLTINEHLMAERIANLSFGIFFLGVIKFILKFFKNGK